MLFESLLMVQNNNIACIAARHTFDELGMWFPSVAKPDLGGPVIGAIEDKAIIDKVLTHPSKTKIQLTGSRFLLLASKDFTVE